MGPTPPTSGHGSAVVGKLRVLYGPFQHSCTSRHLRTMTCEMPTGKATSSAPFALASFTASTARTMFAAAVRSAASGQRRARAASFPPRLSATTSSWHKANLSILARDILPTTHSSMPRAFNNGSRTLLRLGLVRRRGAFPAAADHQQQEETAFGGGGVGEEEYAAVCTFTATATAIVAAAKGEAGARRPVEPEAAAARAAQRRHRGPEVHVHAHARQHV